MDEVLQNLSENIGMLTDINIKSGRVHVSPLGPAVPKEAEELSRRIYRTMMPEAWLEEIIREVDKWTGFSKYFINKNTKTQEFKEEDVEKILAAITAIGTNVGLEKMSQAMGKFSFSQLYTVVQNCLDESNISKATASIIQHQRALWISEYWGEGNTSSSDGRGIRTVVSTLNAEPNPRHGIEKGCTIYRFVSDKYYTFHTKVISTSREYLHVIDGVLAHELMTGEPVLEHYTDTGGYSDPLFGFAHMLGFIYAPRIKGISRSKLFIFQESEEFSNLEDITFNKIHTDWIKDYYQDILRIAYSIKKGHVTGALVMRKLCNKSSKLRRAIVEMGRIERTIFLLRYFASQELRRKIQAGLNKGEANNNLARVVQFGSEGKFTSKDIERQQVKASALSLLMDAITLWNGTYMQRSVEYLERNGENIDRGLLKHVSPQNFAHISFLGHYSFDESLSLGENEYRKLKIEQN